jgi:hypothetical protein
LIKESKKRSKNIYNHTHRLESLVKEQYSEEEKKE